MSVVTRKYDAFRADDLFTPGMPEKFVEIIDGELIATVPAKCAHNKIAWNSQALFHSFRSHRKDLRVGHDNDGFLLSRNPDTLLSPDASIFRARNNVSTTWLEFAPDIAVEVLSASNQRGEIVLKRSRFFEAGAEQFWIVDPQTKVIEFCFNDGRALVVQGEEIIEGQGVAEGMKIDLREIFDLES